MNHICPNTKYAYKSFNVCRLVVKYYPLDFLDLNQGILGVDVRTYVIHLLGIYVTILYNWLIF